jgi:hypothetical protein
MIKMAGPIRNKPEIIGLLEREGIVFKKRGKHLWALCPLHVEKTPSFKVDPDKQSFYCFGCNAGGDIITFVQVYRNLSFKEALDYLHIQKNFTPKSFRELTKRNLIQDFKGWCNDYYDEICTRYRTLNRVKMKVRTMEELEPFNPFIHKEPLWEFYMDILESDDVEAKFQLYKEKVYGE